MPLSTADRKARFVAAALAASDDCIKIIGLDGSLQYMSEGGQRVMEIDDFSALKGCPWPDFWQGQGNADAKAAIEAARDGKTARFQGFANTAKGNSRFWDVKVSPILDDAGVVESIVSISRDITALRKAEQRQQALLDLGDRLRDCSSVEDGGRIAAELMAEVLGSTRAGYGIVDPDSETVRILPDWCAEGISSIAGHHRFREFGSFVDDLKRGENVIIPDVGEDDRTKASEAAFHSLQITSMINLPLMRSGKIIGLALVHDKDARPMSNDEIQFLKSVADRTQAAVAELQVRAEKEVLNQEISHRLKNTLALVQAIANQTLRTVTQREPVEAFEKRVHALSSAHDILLQNNWVTASMAGLIRSVLDALGQDSRIRVDGEDMFLGSRAALSLALLINELATNAMKYGSLSTAHGRVAISWIINGDLLTFKWRESDGPRVIVPKSNGFGSKLIRMGLVGSGGVTFDYSASGIEVTMEASISHLQAS